MFGLHGGRIVEEDLKIPKIRSFIIKVVIRGSMGSRGCRMTTTWGSNGGSMDTIGWS